MDKRNCTDQTPKLIIGLGNPGHRYENTRHNIGFKVIDALYDTIHSDQSLDKRKTVSSICNALVIQTEIHDLPIILAKPMTYMNNSGAAVSALINRFDIPLDDLCIIYDDVHLDIGMIRIRRKGSDGGQKGMQSIIQHLRSVEFPRLRIGIGEPVGEIVDYVLSEFTIDEKAEIEQTIDRAVEALKTWTLEDMQTTMNRFNSR